MGGKITNILIVGVGGQGVVLASDILALASLNAGHDAKKSEIHGMSQRGGSVFSHVRFGGKVHSPVISRGEADILLSFEEMEALRWLAYAGTQTRVICTDTRIVPASLEAYPAGIEEELERCFGNLTLVDTKKTVADIGDAKYVNVALLGIVSKFVSFAEDCWQKAIRDNVPPASFDANWNAFNYGKGIK
jgi:indolepyruvate ferredoxin oxidoreductase, beta subunit